MARLFESRVEYHNFRELLLGMYEGFPNSRISAAQVRFVIRIKEDLEKLEREGYLIKTEKWSSEWYGLGANALQLINAWKLEDLTKKLTFLTILIFVLTAISVGAIIFPFVAR